MNKPFFKEVESEGLYVRRPMERISAMRSVRAVAWLWLWETAIALAVVAPSAVALRSVVGATPDGDAILWQPGALFLGDALMHQLAAIRPLFTLAALALGVNAIVGAFPFGAIVASLAFEMPDGRALRFDAAALAAARRFGRLLLVRLVAFFAILGAALLAMRAAAAARESLESSMGAAASDIFAIGVMILGAVVVSVLVMATDIVSVGAAVEDHRWWTAFRRSAVIYSHAYRAWFAQFAVGGFLVALGLLCTEHIPESHKWGFVAIAVIHQAVIVARACLRVSWLAMLVQRF